MEATEAGASDHATAGGAAGAPARGPARSHPRLPCVAPARRRAWVVFGGRVIADTRRALRVAEVGRPPLFFFPPADVRREHLAETNLRTWSAFRGMASYLDVRVGDRRARHAAWRHQWPAAGCEELAGFVAFFPSRVDACYLDDERVQKPDGDAYGGWVTSDVDLPLQRR